MDNKTENVVIITQNAYLRDGISERFSKDCLMRLDGKNAPLLGMIDDYVVEDGVWDIDNRVIDELVFIWDGVNLTVDYYNADYEGLYITIIYRIHAQVDNVINDITIFALAFTTSPVDYKLTQVGGSQSILCDISKIHTI